MNTEFFDDPIDVVGTMDKEGQVTLQSITWQGQSYPLVTGGRQWLDEEGRHVMAQAVDTTRFELLLTREDLLWRVKKVWRPQFMA